MSTLQVGSICAGRKLLHGVSYDVAGLNPVPCRRARAIVLQLPHVGPG
jgi:hypothetical protein